MRTKLTRFFTITVLALVLCSATAMPLAAQHQNESQLDRMVVCYWETTTIDKVALTVTVVAVTYYSDGETLTTIRIWPIDG